MADAAGKAVYKVRNHIQNFSKTILVLYVYKLGGAILDLDEPSRVKYRCENFLLTPEQWYEERGFVPNVCFPCATLQDGDTGRIAIYYGCADSYVGLAFTDVQTVVEYIQSHDAVCDDDCSEGRR